MVNTLTPMDFINRIVEALFRHETARLDQIITKLIRQNNELHGPYDGFMFGGVVYVPKGLPRGKRSHHGLDDSLSERMRSYLLDQGQIDHDKALIKQILFLLLHPCNSLQKMRDTLPECLIDFIPEFKALPRIQAPGHTLDNKERSQRQFQTILEKIEFYTATRLLY